MIDPSVVGAGVGALGERVGLVGLEVGEDVVGDPVGELVGLLVGLVVGESLGIAANRLNGY